MVFILSNIKRTRSIEYLNQNDLMYKAICTYVYIIIKKIKPSGKFFAWTKLH